MYQFSLHSVEQLAKRNITQEVALGVIENAAEKNNTRWRYSLSKYDTRKQ